MKAPADETIRFGQFFLLTCLVAAAMVVGVYGFLTILPEGH